MSLLSLLSLLFLTGVACIIAAIVGRGLKVGSVELPALESSRRQLFLGGFGVLLIVSVVVYAAVIEPKLAASKPAQNQPAPGAPAQPRVEQKATDHSVNQNGHNNAVGGDDDKKGEK